MDVNKSATIHKLANKCQETSKNLALLITKAQAAKLLGYRELGLTKEERDFLWKAYDLICLYMYRILDERN